MKPQCDDYRLSGPPVQSGLPEGLWLPEDGVTGTRMSRQLITHAINTSTNTYQVPVTVLNPLFHFNATHYYSPRSVL